jgi:hypothetical protein
MDEQAFLHWECTLAAEKSAKFRGSASIKLKVLVFEREANERSAKRLRDLFSKGGHYRLNSCNHVLAVIDLQSFDAAIQASGLSADMLQNNPQGCYKELNFPPGYQLRCLHGLDSARAAAQSVLPGDRRWVVDLFVGGNVLPLSLARVKIADIRVCPRPQPRPGDGYDRTVCLGKTTGRWGIL